MSVKVPPTSTPIILIVSVSQCTLSERAASVGHERLKDRLRRPRVDPEATADVPFVRVLGYVMASAAEARDEEHRGGDLASDDHRIMPGAALHSFAQRVLVRRGVLDASCETLVRIGRLDPANHGRRR